MYVFLAAKKPRVLSKHEKSIRRQPQPKPYRYTSKVEKSNCAVNGETARLLPHTRIRLYTGVYTEKLGAPAPGAFRLRRDAPDRDGRVCSGKGCRSATGGSMPNLACTRAQNISTCARARARVEYSLPLSLSFSFSLPALVAPALLPARAAAHVYSRKKARSRL